MTDALALFVTIHADDPYFARGLAAALAEQGVLVSVDAEAARATPRGRRPIERASADALVGDAAPADASEDDAVAALTLLDDASEIAIALVEGTLRGSVAGPSVWIVDEGEALDLALDGGARGVVLRGIEPASLVAALRSVAHGFFVVDERLEGALFARRGASAEGPRQKPDRGPLTEREAEVLELLAQGLTNKEIAAELSVSAHTAKFHVNGILDKLGAMTRTEAVAIAVRSGLIHL